MTIFVMTTAMVVARPGDIRDASENVDVPPEHRAAPPTQQQQPAQPPYQPRAVFPPGVGAQYPLFFQNGFVPFGSTYNTFPPQQQIQLQRQAIFVAPEQTIVAPIVVAAAI